MVFGSSLLSQTRTCENPNFRVNHTILNVPKVTLAMIRFHMSEPHQQASQLLEFLGLR
jgi:hypothetical protein